MSISSKFIRIPTYETADSAVDRSKLPDARRARLKSSSPPSSARNLANGLKIILAERHATPMVTFNLQRGCRDRGRPVCQPGNGPADDGHAG